MKKILCLTVGQVPRDDVIPEIKPFLKNAAILEKGALDGLTKEEIEKTMSPEKDDYVLISRLKNKEHVTFAEKYILPKLQKLIDEYESDCDLILFLCTGEFPDTFTANRPLIFPQKIISALIPNLINDKALYVIVPKSEQIAQSLKRWSGLVKTVYVGYGNPYDKNFNFEPLISDIKEKNPSMILLDCMGYTESFKTKLQNAVGKPVILSRTLIARVISELI